MPSSMTDSEYHVRADALLRRLELLADAWLQDDVIDLDAQRTGGLLELVFPDRSKLVINKQPPLQEIWLASRAGGFHFAWEKSRWIESRSGLDFDTVFNQQACAQAGQPLPVADTQSE